MSKVKEGAGQGVDRAGLMMVGFWNKDGTELKGQSGGIAIGEPGRQYDKVYYDQVFFFFLDLEG